MSRQGGRSAEVDPARTEQLVQAVVAAPDDERAVDAIIFRVIAEDFVLAARQLHAAREARSEMAKRIKALEDALLPFVAMHPEMFKRADELFDDRAVAP